MFTRSVHQTTQITKTEPKSPAKWHNRTAPQKLTNHISLRTLVFKKKLIILVSVN